MGRQGSGKSTFTTQLAQKLHVEAIHLDNHFHKNGWQRVTKEEWAQIQKELLKKEKWVIDGTYLSSIEPRLQAADTAVFLDIPAHISIFRALRRYWKHKGGARPDFNAGRHERITWRFIKKITTFSKKKVLEKLKENPNIKVIILKSSKEIESFLNRDNL